MDEVDRRARGAFLGVSGGPPEQALEDSSNLLGSVVADALDLRTDQTKLSDLQNDRCLDLLLETFAGFAVRDELRDLFQAPARCPV